MLEYPTLVVLFYKLSIQLLACLYQDHLNNGITALIHNREYNLSENLTLYASSEYLLYKSSDLYSLMAQYHIHIFEDLLKTFSPLVRMKRYNVLDLRLYVQIDLHIHEDSGCKLQYDSDLYTLVLSFYPPFRLKKRKTSKGHSYNLLLCSRQICVY